MKKILVPVDFTKVGTNAIQYAFDLFKEAHFTIFHVIDANLSINEPLSYSMELTREEGVKLRLDQIVRDVENSEKQRQSYTIETVVGPVIRTITSHINKDDFDAVVMGTRDKYDIFDKLLGTVSLGVIKDSDLPVYLIPPTAKYKNYEKVVVASDFHLDSDEVVWAIADWNKTFKADMHFLHIKNHKVFNYSFVSNIVEEYFDKKMVEFPFTIIQKEGRSIANEVIEYAESENADIHIVVTDRASWFDTLTSSSVSREMILKASKPMLFIHSRITKKTRIFFDLLSVEL